MAPIYLNCAGARRGACASAGTEAASLPHAPATVPGHAGSRGLEAKVSDWQRSGRRVAPVPRRRPATRACGEGVELLERALDIGSSTVASGGRSGRRARSRTEVRGDAVQDR